MTYDPNAGSGGGIAKYANMETINAIVDPEEGDVAMTLDAGIMMQYHDGAWVTAYNSMTDPQAGGNWELVGRIKCVAGTTPTVSFDISGCDKFKAKIIVVGTPIGNFGFAFDSDATSTYASQDVYGQNTSVSATRTARNSLFKVDAAYSDGYSEIEFDKRAKTGMFVWQYGKVLSDVNAITYTGTAAMNALTPTGTGSFNGYIEVYKWAEQAKPVELSSYELVKEYTLSNQILNDTIPWDGDVDDEMFVTADFTSPASTNILCILNGDTTAANYPFSNVYGSGSTAASSAGTTAGLLVGSQGASGAWANNVARVQLGRSASRRRGVSFTNTYGSYVRNYASYWANTTNAVTGVAVNSQGVAITGVIRLYKMVKSRLATTNPNLCTLSLKYVDANTVQVQPGEVEINGAVMRVSRPTDVTLSGNLRSGLTEAANTVYYMYAVRGPQGSVPTLMFDTQPPLMDRYGNIAASFEDCNSEKAWMHPMLGNMYRWVGQVLNDASSNILAFTKCAPGLWEGAWAPTPASGAAYAVPHAFGKSSFKPRVAMKSALSDAADNECPTYFSVSDVSYGAHIGSYGTVGAPAKTTSAMSLLFATNMFFRDGAWRTSGYYKLILTAS